MLKVGVIGTGNMGSQHARVYEELSNVCEVVAISDANPAQLERLRKKTGAKLFQNYVDMLEETDLDAVSIALPNDLHHGAVVGCLKKGIDVLVEKPIALSLNDAKDMIKVAKQNDRILMVGHIERFNPAVQFLHRFIADGKLGKIFYLSSRRIGVYPSRFEGPGKFGVSLDLAIHDVDVMRFLMDCPARLVHRENMKRLSQNDDYVCLTLGFGDVLGVIEASWLSPFKIRQLLITGEKGLAMVDYLGQTVDIISGYKDDSEFRGYANFLSLEYEISKPIIKKEEPLKVELSHFLECVSNHSTPSSDGTNGLENLKLVI
jgi:UDP-N-acetylglucosamine 3-dehydrogenase